MYLNLSGIGHFYPDIGQFFCQVKDCYCEFCTSTSSYRVSFRRGEKKRDGRGGGQITLGRNFGRANTLHAVLGVIAPMHSYSRCFLRTQELLADGLRVNKRT